ncbi:OmpA family protein [Desulfonatronum parangueonense]
MHKRFSKLVLVALTALLALSLATAAMAQTERIVPRAENFLFFVDHSGSMAMSAPNETHNSLAPRHDPNKQGKIGYVKEILQAINNDIPNMTFNAGLYTYGPFQEYIAPAPYAQERLGQGIDSLQDQYDIFGRLTPMGLGLQSLDTVVSGLSDRRAVIMTTDGESNLGPNPLPILEDMYAKYGNNICFHVISFAQTPAERALVEQIAAINPCTVAVDGMDLLDDAKRDDFMRRVFYDIEIIPAAPVVEPEPAPAPPVEEVIVFRNINFDFDRSNIRSEFVPVLREAAEIIKARPGRTVVVDGHTCNIGPADYNMGLSQRRAASVRDFLVNEGVAAERIQTLAFGLTAPRFDNNTREGRSLNRRVEIRFE